MVEITKEKSKYLIGTIYRHPKGNVNEFTKKLESTLTKITSYSEIKHCIITGDINIDLIKFENQTVVADYPSTMLRNAFMPTIILPTRVTSHTCTLIDQKFYYSKTHRNNIFSRNLISHTILHVFLSLDLRKNTMRNHMLGYSMTKIKTNLKIHCSPLTGNKHFATKTQINLCLIIYEQLTQRYYKSFPLIKLSNKRRNDKPD